uniref:Ycf36 n=1 Tax=Apoglossum ruscifolium TaxID=167976 RepID=A0A4D6WN46_9FLOR|nr:hypothetical protein [Apoglossum ruscifolium]
MSILNNNCPVPVNQQPLNEYLELKKSFFFAWSTYSSKKYLYTLLMIFFALFIFLGLIIFFVLANFMSFIKLFILNFLLIDIFFLFIFLRLYLGWSYINNRLLSATILYEESGWYDGQIWIKTSNNLIRDRLVGLYEIIPCLRRIKYTCIVFCLNLILHFYLYSSF